MRSLCTDCRCLCRVRAVRGQLWKWGPLRRSSQWRDKHRSSPWMVSGSEDARTMRTGDYSLVGEAEAKAGVWPAAEAKTTERQEAEPKNRASEF